MATCKLPRAIKREPILPPQQPVTVTLTGSGNTTYCYALYNSTKYYSNGNTFQVMPGDTITFYVYGRSSSYQGWVKIDGTTVLTVTNQSTQSYAWTVPTGKHSITIAMSYTSTSSQRRGQITVTTA